MAKRFRLGLDTYSYHLAAPVWPPEPPQPLTLEGYLDRAAELGVDGLALADMGHFTSTDEETLAALKARADGHGLYVELGTGGVDPDHLREALGVAQRLGSPVLRTFASIGTTWRNPADYPASLRRAAAALSQVTDVCEQTGVALAIENHQDLTSLELAELLEEVDHPMVGVCWDTGNSLGVLEHPLDGLQNVAGRTLTVHLKSYALIPQGEGFALVGVPVGHNRGMLAETLAFLARQSPMYPLHVNVESAVEYIPVGPPRPGWRPEHARPARALLAACPPEAPPEPWIPRKDMPIEELLALEDRLVRESIAQARSLLDDCREPTDAGG